MLLALAQVNPKVGDIEANANLVVQHIARARDAGADIVVFPELVLVGYPPKDLLYQEGFITAAASVAQRIGERNSAGITVIFGVPLPVDSGRGIANSLLAYRDGKLLARYD